MFKRLDVPLISNPICNKAVDDIGEDDFNYFDKDGFELNVAEQKFYKVMGYPIHHPILNHVCWQEPWYKVAPHCGLILDHAMILHRCDYVGPARDQLIEIAKTNPTANQLLQTKQKWGYDFDLDGVAPDGSIFEVLHVEYDSLDFTEFQTHMLIFEQSMKRKDWIDLKDQIWQKRDEWVYLKGFEQNHWKAKYILGWEQAEYIEKAI